MTKRPTVKEISNDEIVPINNLLAEEITNLKAKLDKEDDLESKGLGEKSLKDLIFMYKEFQEEINRRGL